MANEPFPDYPSLADAIEDAERVTVRWGHDSVRNLSAGQVAAIVSSLRAPVSERGRIEVLPPKITPEPNRYKIPPRYPVRIGACVFWNEEGHLFASPVGEPHITLGEPMNVLFRELGALPVERPGA